MKRVLVAFACCAWLIAASACKRETAPVAVASAADPSGMDLEAFAGYFETDDLAFDLEADGGYVQYGLAGLAYARGTWTIEGDGKRLRLTASEPDGVNPTVWLFAVVSRNELGCVPSSCERLEDIQTSRLTRVR